MTQFEYNKNTSNAYTKKVFSVVAEDELEKVTGGFIPIAVWAIWGGGAAAAGFSGGIAVGLNRVNRKGK